MKLTEAIKILENHNKWRRDNTGELTMVNPTLLGKAISAMVAPTKEAEKVIEELGIKMSQSGITGEPAMANPKTIGEAIDTVLIAAKFANTVKDEVVNERP